MKWWTSARRQFPVTKDLIYLDIALRNSPPTGVREAIVEFFERADRIASFEDHHFEETVLVVRRAVARLIGAHAHEIAFTKNTSEGINIAANGLGLKSGDNVILTDHEHPANLLPWLRFRDRGVEIRVAQSGERSLDPQRVFDLVDGHTRAIAITHVGYRNGFVNDLSVYGTYSKAHSIPLIVDATQSTGAIAYSLRDLGVSMLACAAHKRLLGPNGVGFLYCSSDWLPRIRPLFAGDSAAVTYDKNDMSMDVDQESALKFEYGNLNYPGLFALRAGLDMILSIGMPSIEERVRALSKRLSDGLAEAGVNVISPLDPCGIVIILNHDARKLHALLLENKVKVSLQSDRHIRMSPHFYNTDEEIATVVGLVREFMNRPQTMR